MGMWVDKGSQFYNSSFKKCLKDKNEGKSVVAERFIRTLNNKIYKHMTAASKNVYIDKLDDVVNEYNNTYHRTIKRSLLDSTCIDSIKEVNDKDSKFKVGDHAILLKIQKHFC